MIYWLQEASSGPSALLSGGVVGAVVGLVGVVIGQYLTQRRHSQSLRQTAELEAQRAHEAALEKYVEHLGKLLTEQQLRHAAADDHLRTVARAHTLAVLEGLDPDRKGILLQFLHESNLIHLDKPVISLLGASLKGANLKGANLPRANLKRADLRGPTCEGRLARGQPERSQLPKSPLRRSQPPRSKPRKSQPPRSHSAYSRTA